MTMPTDLAQSPNLVSRDALDPGVSREAGGSRAVALPGFQRLLAFKRRVIGPFLTLSLAYFLGVMLLAGFSRPLMGVKVAGSLNLGYVLIILTYLICWGVAILYVAIAGSRFEAKAAEALAELKQEETM